MKKILLVTFALVFMASAAFAQGMGSVSGTVHDTLNNPIGGADISMMNRDHQYHTRSAMDDSQLRTSCQGHTWQKRTK